MLYGAKPLRDAYSSIVTLYESFIGPIHIRAMSRFLGYQGIAMILEQLLYVTEAQVRSAATIVSVIWIHPISSFLSHSNLIPTPFDQ